MASARTLRALPEVRGAPNLPPNSPEAPDLFFCSETQMFLFEWEGAWRVNASVDGSAPAARRVRCLAVGSGATSRSSALSQSWLRQVSPLGLEYTKICTCSDVATTNLRAATFRFRV